MLDSNQTERVQPSIEDWSSGDMCLCILQLGHLKLHNMSSKHSAASQHTVVKLQPCCSAGHTFVGVYPGKSKQ